MVPFIAPASVKEELKLKTMPLKHVWEIDSCLRCPVAGACLDEADYRRILGKAGFRTRRMNLHEMHGTVVENMAEENELSARLDRLLRKRYRKTVSAVIKMDETELMDAWEKGCRNGAFEEILFAVAVRPGVSGKLLSRVFGDAHMMGHTHNRELMAERVKLQKAENRIRMLTEQLKAEKKNQKMLVRQNRELEKQVKVLVIQQEHKAATGSGTSHGNGDKGAPSRENRDLELKIGTLKQDNRRLSDRLLAAEKEKDRLLAESLEQKEVNETLNKEIDELISRISLMVDGCPAENRECDGPSCPAYNICAEKILIVGGVTKIKHLYRDLVESNGGIFDYHDGYMTSGKQNLEARIKRSDLVICPVNCNSHGACSKVKQLCKKHNKAISLLASSSLSAISEAILEKSPCLN